MFATALLVISALVFSSIGVYFLAMPDRAAASIGMKLTDDNARTDVRATYGGMVLGIALVFGLSAVKSTMLTSGLLTLVLVYGCMALGRGLALITGDRPEAQMKLFLGIEIVFVIAGAFVLIQI